MNLRSVSIKLVATVLLFGVCVAAVEIAARAYIWIKIPAEGLSLPQAGILATQTKSRTGNSG